VEHRAVEELFETRLSVFEIRDAVRSVLLQCAFRACANDADAGEVVDHLQVRVAIDGEVHKHFHSLVWNADDV